MPKKSKTPKTPKAKTEKPKEIVPQEVLDDFWYTIRDGEGAEEVGEQYTLFYDQVKKECGDFYPLTIYGLRRAEDFLETIILFQALGATVREDSCANDAGDPVAIGGMGFLVFFPPTVPFPKRPKVTFVIEEEVKPTKRKRKK